MADSGKQLGFIRNKADSGLVHLVFEGGGLSAAFPVGHVLEAIADGMVPFKEFTESEWEELTHA